jgi:hypothetical protein
LHQNRRNCLDHLRGRDDEGKRDPLSAGSAAHRWHAIRYLFGM